MTNKEKNAFYDAINHTKNTMNNGTEYKYVEEDIETKIRKFKLKQEANEIDQARKILNNAIEKNTQIKEATLELFHTLAKYNKLNSDFYFSAFVNDVFPIGTFGAFTFENLFTDDFKINFDFGSMQDENRGRNIYDCFGITMDSKRDVHYEVLFMQKLYLMAKEQLPMYHKQDKLDENNLSSCTRIISCVDGHYTDDIEIKIVPKDEGKYHVNDIIGYNGICEHHQNKKYSYHKEVLENEKIKSLDKFIKLEGLDILDTVHYENNLLFFGKRDNQALDYDWLLRLQNLKDNKMKVLNTTYSELQIKPTLNKLPYIMNQMYDAYLEFYTSYKDNYQKRI